MRISDWSSDVCSSDLLDQVVPQEGVAFDVRSLCVIREALTYEEALADAMFTMQGIGTHAIQSFGTVAQKQRYLPPCRSGDKVAAFALTEPATGSDVASMTTSAVRDGGDYVINAAKTLISNSGFADNFILVARPRQAPGPPGLP